MQLNLEFLANPEPSSRPTPASPQPTAWDQLDECARTEALGMLAMLIARMLATTATKTATPATEAGHD